MLHNEVNILLDTRDVAHMRFIGLFHRRSTAHCLFHGESVELRCGDESSDFWGNTMGGGRIRKTQWPCRLNLSRK